jgi:hypothetical protein
MAIESVGGLGTTCPIRSVAAKLANQQAAVESIRGLRTACPDPLQLN